MKAPVYNQEGKEVKKIDLPKSIFGLSVNDDLVHQVTVSQMANKRQVNAHTKDRSEVRGGGRKPWRQKGTGRARHGSTRSPIWKGGGVTFGPRNEKIYKKRVPKEMRRKALLMTLSGKLKDNEILFIDSLKIDKSKTSIVSEILNKLPFDKKKALIVFCHPNRNLVLASRNIPEIETIPVKNINPLDLLSFKNLIIAEDAIKVIEETFV